MASLGQELKRAREERGVALTDIANATHIGVRFLQAIENDSYDVLPGGVFNRAFVRKFAKQVGFDEEQAVRLYEEQLEEMGGEPQRRYYFGVEDLEPKPPASNGLLFSLLALIILAAGAYLAYEYFNNKPGPAVTRVNAPPRPPSTPSPTPVASPTPSIVSESPTTLPASNLTVGPLKLQLRTADDDCWVKVTEDEAKPKETIMQPGQLLEYNANERLVLSMGNLPALKMIVNGHEINQEKLREKLLPNKKGTIFNMTLVITKDNYQQYID